jgi:hypothetical protein
VKEAIKNLHRALRDSIAAKSKVSDWRPKRTVVYYGSYVSFLVQTELYRLRLFNYPLTKPEDFDIATDINADEMCFKCSSQSDMMKRKTDAPPVEITHHELRTEDKLHSLPVNLSFYSNLHGRKLLDKCDSDITGINAVVIENLSYPYIHILSLRSSFAVSIQLGYICTFYFSQ